MPYLGLIFNAMVWGLSWWPLRQLHALGLHPLWATALFFLIGLVLTLAWQPSAWTDFRRCRALWVLALAAGATNTAFNWAVSIGEVVRVVLLFYLMPLWAVLLAWLMLGERLTWAALGRVLLALAGAWLVLRPVDAAWPVFSGLPDVLAVGGGFGFALTNVLLRQQAHRSASARSLAMFLGAALLPGVLAYGLAAQGIIPSWPAWDVRWVLGAAALGLTVVAANVALQYSAARLPVQISSVVMLTEILFAAGSAVWLAGEMLTPTLLIGGALISLAALLTAREGVS
ncbi:MAG: DMT family transporter [Burkholderiales bacterium]|nr:DMT family transporter [Burkholderiales bacterium]